MRQSAFWMLLAFVFVVSACEDKPKQQEVIVVEEPEPVVDSVQLQVVAYEQQLAEADEDISKTLRQLDRLSAQLQDSINGTEVPAQFQEEIINNYRNQLHDVRQVRAALNQWKERDARPADTLTTQERKEFLENQLEQLDRLMQETRQVRYEAQTTIKEADLYEN